jgi:flagellar biosynthetic protein FliR
MIEALTALSDLVDGSLPVAYLVFLRVGTAMAFLPAFGEQMIPTRVKLAAAIAFTAVVAPTVWHTAPASVSAVHLFTEIGMGAALGLSLRLQIMALQVAASIAAQVTSLSQLLGGAAVDPQPALGVVLLLAALALAASLGLHVQYAGMFIRSYDLVGFGAGFPTDVFGAWMVAAVNDMFSFALLLAMPFVAVSLLYNLALGVINRAMPQLMVAFVGAPAITYGALILLALCAPILLTVWVHVFSNQISNPFGQR